MTTMARHAVWSESKEAFRRLQAACAKNCECDKATIINPSPPKCSVCLMLTNQEALNRLAFVWTQREKLDLSEWKAPDG